jgi:integrase
LATFRDQIAPARNEEYLFPSELSSAEYQYSLRTAWRLTLNGVKIPYFRIHDLRSTYATWLSAGGIAGERVTQLLRQGGSQIFKKYSQMKLKMQ